MNEKLKKLQRENVELKKQLAEKTAQLEQVIKILKGECRD